MMILAMIAAVALQATPQERTWGLTDPVVTDYDAISDVVPQMTADGWTYRGKGMSGAEMFTRPANQARRLWVRYEYTEPNATGHLSDRQLNEFDCDGRYRTLQYHAFSEHGLLGAGQDLPASGWTYIAPDTMAEQQERQACSAR